MKTILRKTSTLLAAVLLLGSCIKETEPTSVATPDQINKNSAALEATITGICSALHKNYFGYNANNNSAFPFDFGYEAMAQIRDLYCQDMPLINAEGWDWFSPWSRNVAMGDGYLYGQLVWNYYWALLKTANDAISVIDEDSATATQLHYLGIAKCFRALAYLDMGRMYEFKPNKYTSAPEVEGLTVQIVTPGMTEAEARDNPRVTKEKMCEFILGDLEDAVKFLDGYVPAARNFPTQSVAYGLMARTYLWLEDYPKAKQAAQDALDAGSYSVLTSAQWHDTATGFNNSSATGSWMWADMISSTDPTLVNDDGAASWMGWISNEQMFGYSGYAGGLRAADRSFYERISDTDFRKTSFLAPRGSALREQTRFCASTDPDLIAILPDYSSVKFRPGQGNTTVPTVGGAVDFPLMRCEEMHFIIAECDAHSGSATALVNLVKTRDPNYTCTKTGDDLIEEVIFQKRVEFWGEGIVFFDFKRLNLSITRGYKGTNHLVDLSAFNTDGMAPWLNQCAVRTEHSQNPAFVNNPDPSGTVPFWKDPDAAGN
ncbi:RagB/SusD family nutrient uptake outer membrane protein [uncultured Alistipes sp.]|uniref:RagB/SusD family nutrient uptake outer membrane protein n=1 Tax=uncultured Alistipes sp. TaxID=538949 RepID=UPI0025EE0404|nr:RagB/SusD family nutrient uptake outer membrane protein [uncultured Alistipes sp.]